MEQFVKLYTQAANDRFLFLLFSDFSTSRLLTSSTRAWIFINIQYVEDYSMCVILGNKNNF